MLPLLSVTANAQDVTDLAKAKAEAKVSWYTSTPIEQAQKIVAAFKRETGIEVELFRSGGSAILSRFQQEMTAGRAATDVLTHSDPAAARALAKRGFFTSFRPKNFDKIPAAAKDAAGQWIGQRLNSRQGSQSSIWLMSGSRYAARAYIT